MEGVYPLKVSIIQDLDSSSLMIHYMKIDVLGSNIYWKRPNFIMLENKIFKNL